MSTKIELVKTATSWIVGAGVGTIVHAIIKNNTQPSTYIDELGETQTEHVSRSQSVTVPAASVVVSWMAKEACSDFTDAKIDEAVVLWQKYISKTYVEPTTETEK